MWYADPLSRGPVLNRVLIVIVAVFIIGTVIGSLGLVLSDVLGFGDCPNQGCFPFP